MYIPMHGTGSVQLGSSKYQCKATHAIRLAHANLYSAACCPYGLRHYYKSSKVASCLN